jgi:hypothetical protein
VSDTKHTPGPWTFRAEPDGPEVPFDYTGPGFYDNPTLYGPSGEHVVGCDEYYVFGGPADARLLAAAPDLLAALQMICDSGVNLAEPIERAMLDAIAKAVQS